ncbi:hypothetical protein Pfo_028885 [Paulownia fortunei]|nr:hypothetical protein Pfo_028885 [Paulownia fortunei]
MFRMEIDSPPESIAPSHYDLIIQWLMFEGEPKVALEQLAKLSANQRGVCGAVWGNNDIAYRCRTCEHDPTCAICVPCFEHGNHKDHDYSVIYTGGGCCDCGDITAWKREGFCLNHKGAEQIQPLPEHVVKSLGPVLDFLLCYWKEKLLSAKNDSEETSRAVAHVAELPKAANELTSAVVEMLLDFCKHSESLLRAERVMNDSVVGKLHELLLKLLGEPIFKYEFAKVFVIYYPAIVNAAISESGDTAFKKYPLLATFSVQIFTVPTLTPRLVEEMNLLGVLLQCLETIFICCAREDGRLQVAKWANLYETTLRVVEDIRFVMSHCTVTNYLCNSRRDLVRTWMRLLASVQGMNTQKRETGSQVEDENENVHLPFVLCHSISNILSLLVAGAFSMSSNEDTYEEAFFCTHKLECEDLDSLRHAKVGRLSQESSVSSNTGKSTLAHGAKAADGFSIPLSALWLVYECLRSMESWLVLDNTVGPLNALSLKTSNGSGNNFLALKSALSKFRRGSYIFKSSTSSNSGPTLSSEALNKQCFSPSRGGFNIGVGLECGQPMGQEAGPGGCDDNMLEGESTSELEGLRVLSLSDWPDISYDVSSQDISVHIPLHRLLSMVLRRALKFFYGESGSSYMLSASSADRSFVRYGDFLGQILEGCHPYGFSAFVMEHPLRIRVFCAEVLAGMWRRNGDTPILFSEWYRSVRWSEQGQDLDLFLLQCCAALAPADLYVQRILERFGLSNYLSLNLEQSSEHETTLVAEMLTLLIQIVNERRFCGLTNSECLQRELVYKLSIGDATHSQLVKSLPRDLSKVDELQEVLDTVAEYSHPSGITQGMYKLRSLYWKELDLYHPRWNLRDQQAAEERYSRFCNVSALITQLPRWTKIYYPLRGLAKIATCKTLLQIVRAVLFYAVFTDKLMISRAPDGVLLTALHLLALALDVCRVYKESGDPLCYVGDVIPILAFASEEICISKYGDQSMLSLLVILMRMHEKENEEKFMEAGNFSLSSLILSLIKMFVELEPGCMTKLQTLAPELANQFSHTILNGNAKDRESAFDSEKRKAKSRERQAAIMEKMRAQQSKFLENFNSIGDDKMDDTKSEQEVSGSEVSNDSQESAQVICSLCHDPKSKSPLSFLVLLQKSRLLSFVDGGPLSWEQVSRLLVDLVQSAVNDFASLGQPREVSAFMEFITTRFTSIKNVQLPCTSKDTRERTASSLETLEEQMYLVIRGFQSTALPKEPVDNPSASQNGRSRSDRKRSESNTLHAASDKFGPSGGDGIYISSCGHAVHQGCLDRYLSSLRERYVRRIVFEGGHIVDPDQGEFLCPVCRGLANSVLPALSGDLRKVPQQPAVSTINFTDVSGPSTSSDIGKPLIDSMGHTEVLSSCRQKLLLDQESSLSANYSLGALYKELNSSNGFILSLLLDVIQNTRTTNSLTVLLRLRGIQLFARSLCPGTSASELSNYSCQQGGNLLYILENAEAEVQYPDIQLWRRAAEPVLAHDSFSSLMWIIFCLPWPVLSCKESYLSLVHVFYVVTVTQAIITYCKKSKALKLNWDSVIV